MGSISQTYMDEIKWDISKIHLIEKIEMLCPSSVIITNVNRYNIVGF